MCGRYLLFYHYYVYRDLHSFPTRRLFRSLAHHKLFRPSTQRICHQSRPQRNRGVSTARSCRLTSALVDRKSTRLNSSHTVISYAVFCLKKKKHVLTLVLRGRS